MKKIIMLAMVLGLLGLLGLVGTSHADMINVALGGVATQSSTWNKGGYYAPASLAIDGYTDAPGEAPYIHQISHTYADYDPFSWWQVDLRNTYEIGSIVIWNRNENDGILEYEQMQARLSNLKVSVLSSDGTVVWDTIIPPATYPIVGGFPDPSTYPNPSWTLYLPNDIEGQIVKIERLNQDYLWFAEVQVYAVPEPATMFLLGSGLIGLAGLARKKFFKK